MVVLVFALVEDACDDQVPVVILLHQQLEVPLLPRAFELVAVLIQEAEYLGWVRKIFFSDFDVALDVNEDNLVAHLQEGVGEYREEHYQDVK